jgi:ABC-type sugar transport system permease subunit
MAATPTTHQVQQSSFFTSARWRILRENLTAHLFLLPANILIFVFGLFPIGFAFFVSLHRWRRFPDAYTGIDHYSRALSDFAYVLFFWFALLALGYGVYTLVRLWRESKHERRELSALIPGILNAAAILLFINWIAILLPLILTIPQRIRGQERVQGLFVNELLASLRIPAAAEAGTLWLVVALIALGTSLVWGLWVRTQGRSTALYHASASALCFGVGALLLQMINTEITEAVLAAQTDGGTTAIWIQVILISVGVALLGVAWWVWKSALKPAASDHRFVLLGVAAAMLVVAAYILIAELPRVWATADPNMLSGFSITAMFSLLTVPIQLALGLALAYMLFQNIKGKSFFRMMYFLPYITPFVATSIVFRIIFGFRSGSPANQFLGAFGVPPQQWLLEPTGIVRLIFGTGVPDWLAGPSLALIVIILYTAWTYIGYCTVVFLAGLGTISTELYEAAKIDGAGSWSIFRRITLPLLSPTTFFLSLIAVIGTFQAFTQIWIMRTPAAQNSVDTIGVYIYETISSGDPNYGYASALALVLFVVILLLTIIQNRYANDKVFYG